MTYLERVCSSAMASSASSPRRGSRCARYRPMTVRHFLYTDVGVALADMMRLVEQDAVDALRHPRRCATT